MSIDSVAGLHGKNGYTKTLMGISTVACLCMSKTVSKDISLRVFTLHIVV